MSDVWTYITKLWPAWIAVVAGGWGPALLDTTLNMFWPNWRVWAARTWLTEGRVHLLRVLYLMGALFVGGFIVWKNEHAERVTAEKAIVKLNSDLSSWKAQAQKTIPPQAVPPPSPAPTQAIKPEPAPHLVHMLETLSSTPFLDGLNAAGVHAGVASDIVSFSLSGLQVGVKNHGPDTVSWRISNADIYLDGKFLGKAGSKDWRMLPPTGVDNSNILLAQPAALNEQNSSIEVKYTVEYDTAPPTGVRHSSRKLKSIIQWKPPDTMNFRKGHPELQTSASEERED